MAAKAPSRRGELRPTKAVSWDIPGFDEPFVQDPLTFFEKNELFGLLARAIEDVVMTTGDVASLMTLLGIDDAMLERLRQGDVDQDFLVALPGMTSMLTRLVSSVPGLMEDLFLLVLSVPLERRREVREGLRLIDDDEVGFGILDTFVEQNAKTMRDFLPRWRAFFDGLRANLSTGQSSAPEPTLIA